MTDFNFLRIKWPKLAAIAADASRLVEVSPSSAISTMQNFCEWAADIALDLYDIKTQSGITQQEKIETLKATGNAPVDVIGRFQNVLLAGSSRLYRQNEDVEEARVCIEDVYEIGRWLNKEADRAGWPPKNEYYSPIMSPIGMPAEGGGFASGGIGEKIKGFQPLIIAAIAALVIIAIATFFIVSIINNGNTPKPTLPVITPTPTLTSTLLQETTPGADVTPSPAPETVQFLDALKNAFTSTVNTYFLGKWTFQSGDKPFTISDKQYQNGVGMYVAYKSIAGTSATITVKIKLDGAYDKLRFSLGVDSNLDYGSAYGTFRVIIYKNSTSDSAIVYTSGKQQYDYTDLGKEVDITGCTTLYIKLTEWKGTKKNTLNIVLGDIRLVKGGAAVTGTAGGVSPSPSPTGSATATGGSASATATGGEQVNPP